MGASACDGGAPDTLCGFEHEYQLHRAGEPVDFREIIHRLPIRGRRLDPGDAHAYRLSSGFVLTCDDAEAEVATPPLELRPGFGGQVEAWAAAGKDELDRLLPTGVEALGFSTHLSVSLPDATALPVLNLYSRTFAPAAMLLFEGAGSLGVYVRPRPGRLEICGDHAMGADLAAAAIFFAGAARACADAIADNAAAMGRLPPLLEVDLRPASGRYGLYIGRRQALGFDLIAEGRQARLPIAGGGSMIAQENIDLAWQAAREALGDVVGPKDLEAIEAVVSGERSAPAEAAAGAQFERPKMNAPARHIAGTVIDPVRRPAFTAEATIATWDFTVFRLRGRRQAYACVPRDAQSTFLLRLGEGHLDASIEAFLASDPSGRRLQHREQTRAAALWDELAPGSQLLSQERDADGAPAAPDEGSAPGVRSGKAPDAWPATGVRPGKAPSEVAVRPGNTPVVTLARPGKMPIVTAIRPNNTPVVSVARPGKTTSSIGQAEGAPPVVSAPSPPARPPASLPAEPPAPPPHASEPPPPRPSGCALLPVSVVATATAVVLAGVALAWSTFSGGSPPIETLRPTETQSATKTSSPTNSPRPTSSATRSPIVTPRATLTVATPRPLATASGTPTSEPSPTLIDRTPEPTFASATVVPSTGEAPPTETRAPIPTRIDPTSTDPPPPTVPVPDTPTPTLPRITAVP